MARVDMFTSIYQICNHGSNFEKMNKHAVEGDAYPKYIDIELTNHCNLSCYMCPVGTRAMKREQGFLSIELIDKLCGELQDSDIHGVRLIRWGEPVMHPKFLDILKKLKDTGAAVHFNTNGILLTSEMISRIIDLEIDSVKFSFQGVDRTSYEEMRAGSSWDKLMENIRLMNKLRGDKAKPFIQISTTTTDESQERIDQFLQLVSPLCDYANVGRTELCHLNILDMQISEERKQKFLELKARETLQKQHLPVCPEVYDKLSVNWDGTVSACCSDYDNMMIVGNLNENTLRDIYTGEKINKIREIISRDGYDDIPLCKTCYQYIELRKR